MMKAQVQGRRTHIWTAQQPTNYYGFFEFKIVHSSWLGLNVPRVQEMRIKIKFDLKRGIGRRRPFGGIVVEGKNFLLAKNFRFNSNRWSAHSDRLLLL